MDINEAKANVEIYDKKLKDLAKNLGLLESCIIFIENGKFEEYKDYMYGKSKDDIYKSIREYEINSTNILDFYIKESCNIQDTLLELNECDEKETYSELNRIINSIIMLCNDVIYHNSKDKFTAQLRHMSIRTLKIISPLKESKKQQENKSKANFIEQLKNILEERQAKYGEPKQNFEDIGKRWSKILGIEVTPKQVAIMMIEFKLVRLNKTVDCYDTLLDICGYCECMSRL